MWRSRERSLTPVPAEEGTCPLDRAGWCRQDLPGPGARCGRTRAAHSVLFRRADLLLRELGQARADHSFEIVFRRYLAPDLLIVDDFGLQRLNQQQSEDLYALVIERHRRASFIVTSNRDVSEWVGLFADPILANSTLDRLANGAHQLVIEGPSYRAKLAPRPLQKPSMA